MGEDDVETAEPTPAEAGEISGGQQDVSGVPVPPQDDEAEATESEVVPGDEAAPADSALPQAEMDVVETTNVAASEENDEPSRVDALEKANHGEGADQFEPESVVDTVEAPADTAASPDSQPDRLDPEPQPEPVVVELSEEEKLLLCIKWLERRIDYAIDAPLTEESRTVISAFFSDIASRGSIYAFVDTTDGKVHVSKEPPIAEQCQGSVQYFFKNSDAVVDGIPDVKQLQQLVLFGYLRPGNLVFDFTSIVGNLTLPLLRANTTWPASLRKDLVGTLERFMGSMSDAMNSVEGNTILYVPKDDLSAPEVCAKDRDLVQRLEECVIHWTRQMKALISGGQGKQVEDR